MAKIKRVRTTTSSQRGRTPLLGNVVSKFDFAKLAPRNMKTRVRRLHRYDPANAMTQDALFDQFTNNPNLKHQPLGTFSGGEPPLSPTGGVSGGATKISRPKPPKGYATGHDAQIKRPNKVLRDRTANDKEIPL